MATLAGQRAQFTWALNQYNVAEDAEKRAYYAKRMAKYVAAAPANGFTVEQVTQGQLYPAAEVAQCLPAASTDTDAGISEDEALNEVAQAVDTSDVVRRGEGLKTVYAYGYRCAPDRLKIGLTEDDTVERIAAQIGTSTPDKPVLLLEIKTHECGALERAIHAILDYRGRRIQGAGREWFRADRDEVVSILQIHHRGIAAAVRLLRLSPCGWCRSHHTPTAPPSARGSWAASQVPSPCSIAAPAWPITSE